ncbi:hypothetical protein ACH2GM_006213 [Pseudomonas aeruginosa]|jgi:hypothetical protein|uniref:hypothetical protein n=1 Tax=Pseudomonas TaxID=286 RepID=UPI0015F7921B|nr:MULTISPECIES: hypothetical protein [Pseudomonas]EKT8672214.1 hypothetical protein [Pseudomonas aeruginosa]MBA6127743.1 hypothetical protein [Pseudomonas juntendi]MCE0940467.1 hypothetical protein [Pseudomonas kurunegalensis]
MKLSNIFIFLGCLIILPTSFFEDPVQAMGATTVYVVIAVSVLAFIAGIAFWAIEHSRGE